MVKKQRGVLNRQTRDAMHQKTFFYFIQIFKILQLIVCNNWYGTLYFASLVSFQYIYDDTDQAIMAS